MAAKVTFDPNDRLIIITTTPVLDVIDIDFNVDVYSDGKEDWISDPVLNGMRFPIRVVGGDPIDPSRNLGATYFLQYGWRIRPYEANHDFSLEGNVFTEEGDSPIIDTVGAYNVRTEYARSNIIDQIASPQEIADSVWEAPITDYLSGSEGTMAGKVIGGSAYDTYPK